MRTIDYCKEHRISTFLVSELSRMGRNAFEVHASVKEFIDSGIRSTQVALLAKNLYIQKEQFNLLGEDDKTSLFAPVMLAPLSTCVQLECDNITFRLQSGRNQYIAKGGKLGRKPGSTKSTDKKKRRIQGSHFPFEEGLCHQGRGKADRKGHQHYPANKEGVLLKTPFVNRTNVYVSPNG